MKSHLIVLQNKLRDRLILPRAWLVQKEIKQYSNSGQELRSISREFFTSVVGWQQQNLHVKSKLKIPTLGQRQALRASNASA